MIGISAVFAEFERETIQLRITDNYYSRIERDGRWPGGPAPYGYRIKPHSKPSMLEYEPRARHNHRAVRKTMLLGGS